MAVKVQLVNPQPQLQTFGNSSLNTLSKSMDLLKSIPASEVKAYYENPIRLATAMNYKDKPSSLSFNILYQMSVRNSVIAAVINTRINQVSTFTKPKRFAMDGMGFEIRLRDPQQVPNKRQQQIIKALENFLENCGYEYDNSSDDFDTFIRKIVRDSLTYDQACFEIVPDRKGLPAKILAVDAATIRSASEDYDGETIWSAKQPSKKDKVSWVQVIDNAIVAWFTSNELAFGVRNPRSNINLQPYGFSELEQLIQQITSHLYAEEYNAKFFSQGGTTKGIINLKADPNGIGNKEQLDSFKRQWRAQVNGMEGAWKTPVLQVPNGIEYINVSQSNRDMEFNQWMNYLINIVCAVYAIDPAEINFANNGGVAAQSSVFENSQEQKLKNSKDKGLKPLLRFVETIINKWIISRFSQDYVFAFVGLDEQSESDKADLDTKQSKTWKTINEIRKEHGEQPIDDGDVILDPSWLTYHEQQQMQKQQQDQQDDDEDDQYSDDNSENDQDEDSQNNQESDEEESDDTSGDDSDDQDDSDEDDDESDTKKSLSKLIITIKD